MAMVVTFNMVNIAGSPQQNAGIFVGETAMTGWDANQKQNFAMGGNFGSLDVRQANFSWQFDPDAVDAIINDLDNKAALNTNV